MTGLLSALVVLTAPSPSPSPTDVLRPDLNPYDVTPGLLGFLAAFFLALVGILGWFSMNRKVRRIAYDERAGKATEATEATEAAEAEKAPQAAKEAEATEVAETPSGDAVPGEATSDGAGERTP
ncbi:MAG: hypothetical protein ACTMIR_10330 [Cellulomonadaceae bacterium]